MTDLIVRYRWTAWWVAYLGYCWVVLEVVR